MTAEEPTLDDKAAEFANDLTALTRGVLGQDSPSFSSLGAGNRIWVCPRLEDGSYTSIPVTINGEHCLNLHVQHYCCWDAPRKFLATDDAEVHVYFEGSTDPLLRSEYVRKSEEPPGAHWHVHAHRDEIAYLLRLADRKKGKPAQRMRQGRVPRLAEIHVPVGGHRMRPALEDVLLLLEREFAIDVEPGWRKVVDRYLQGWRIVQLKSAVRDAHESAAEVLRELGYTVQAPGDIGPQRPGRLFWP